MPSVGKGATGAEAALRDQKEKVSGPTRERGGGREAGAGEVPPSFQGATRNTCKPTRMGRMS